jgi:xanthosine utilization system XapX-like protein
MDYCLLALGVMGSATGFILVALGVHHEYSPAIVIVGTIFLVGFLAMIFAWSISHRLMVLTTMERQTNEMLEELLRRTER